MRIIRTPPAQDPIVRAEWHGNKYYVPQSWTRRRRRPWLGLAFVALTIVYIAAIVLGRLG